MYIQKVVFINGICEMLYFYNDENNYIVCRTKTGSIREVILLETPNFEEARTYFISQ